MSKKYFELKDKVNAIETTVHCILDEIVAIEEDIEKDLYDEDELEESKKELKYLNDTIDYLGKLRDEYYLWSLERMFEDEE